MATLFEDQIHQPLANQMRPASLKEIVGQQAIVGKDGVVQKLVTNQQPRSLLLWGPPGTGKTTLARILARSWQLEFSEISAVMSGVKDIRSIVKAAKELRLQGQGSLLFIDEIHRFNKSQQDALLPHVEDGTLVLIGATTENPSFEINNALLSRLHVVRLEQLSKKDLSELVRRAEKQCKRALTKSAKELVVHAAAGDGRRLLNIIETAVALQPEGNISKATTQQAIATATLAYDKHGEDHYNLASALIKALRGSDRQASLYYLQRMLAGGADPLFVARRLVIFASEDIGMAAPYSLTLATAGYQAVERIGLPEAEYALTHVTIALADSPKSRDVADELQRFKSLAKQFPKAEVPKSIRNAPTEFMRGQGYNSGYNWQADFKPDNGFLPPEVEHELRSG